MISQPSIPCSPAMLALVSAVARAAVVARTLFTYAWTAENSILLLAISRDTGKPIGMSQTKRLKSVQSVRRSTSLCQLSRCISELITKVVYVRFVVNHSVVLGSCRAICGHILARSHSDAPFAASRLPTSRISVHTFRHTLPPNRTSAHGAIKLSRLNHTYASIPKAPACAPTAVIRAKLIMRLTVSRLVRATQIKSTNLST